MVLDSQRNAAYDGAIRRAVARLRTQGCTELLALDLGAGTGLLAMMAARWDAGPGAQLGPRALHDGSLTNRAFAHAHRGRHAQ